MLEIDFVAKVNRMSEVHRAELFLHLIEQLERDLCPMLTSVGISKGSALIPHALPDDLKVFPIAQTGWNLVGIDVDKILGF